MRITSAIATFLLTIDFGRADQDNGSRLLRRKQRINLGEERHYNRQEHQSLRQRIASPMSYFGTMENAFGGEEQWVNLVSGHGEARLGTFGSNMKQLDHADFGEVAKLILNAAQMSMDTSVPSSLPSSIPSSIPSISFAPSTSAVPSLSPAPSMIPSSSPSVICRNPTNRTDTINNEINKMSSTTDLQNPNSPQSRARNWMLSIDLETDGCNGTATIQQRYALAVFYYSTDGNVTWIGSDNWLQNGVSVCTWFGLRCDSAGTLNRIDLDSNILRGTIPRELFIGVPSIRRFDVHKNQLSGTIPTEIGSLTGLEVIDIEDNGLTGPFFTPEFNLLNSTLRKLRISKNEFTGELPTEIGLFESLDDLWFARNLFVGSIPTEVGALTLLTEILAYNNSLTGTIPSEIGQLTGSLKWFVSANNTQMNGPIPQEFYGLTNLVKFEVTSSGLSGTISPQITSLTKLKYLGLDENSFTSVLPDLSSLSNLETVAVDKNSFEGGLPSDVQNWRNLTYFDFSDNLFNGTISSTYFDNKPFLENFYLHNNNLTGTIPSNWHSPPNLIDLFLDGNDLVGSIPSVPVGGFPKIQEIILNRNELTGAVPEQLCVLRDNSPLRPNSTEKVFVALWTDCAGNGTSPRNPCRAGCCTKCTVGGPGS